MESLADIRKAIKPLGFSVKTKSTSFGKHATYIHKESGQELTFNVFSPELLERWRPLIEWGKAHSKEIDAIRKEESIVGLKL